DYGRELSDLPPRQPRVAPDQEAEAREARFRAAQEARRRAGSGQPQLVEGAKLPNYSRAPRSVGDRSWSDVERRMLIRAEELAAQGRAEDAAMVRFMVGRPLPRPLPRYLLDLLDEELLDLLDQEPELPMPQPRHRQE